MHYVSFGVRPCQFALDVVAGDGGGDGEVADDGVVFIEVGEGVHLVTLTALPLASHTHPRAQWRLPLIVALLGSLVGLLGCGLEDAGDPVDERLCVVSVMCDDDAVELAVDGLELISPPHHLCQFALQLIDSGQQLLLLGRQAGALRGGGRGELLGRRGAQSSPALHRQRQYLQSPTPHHPSYHFAVSPPLPLPSLSSAGIIFKLMEHPFLAEHLSQIHEADTLYDSRMSSFSHSHVPQQGQFQQQRAFAKSVLSGWGMTMGEMPFSRDNQLTLRCLLELVAHRQKDLLFRSRVKDDQAALQFERDKFRSFAQQAQRTAEEYLRKVGMLENELLGLRTRGKKGEAQVRREREEDRKIIAGLRAKNEQALHEVKKKEAEVGRVREQLKKSVGEKSSSTKGSFEVFLPLRAASKEEETDKYAFLLERNQRELSVAVKENVLLREKLFEIRQLLVHFNFWIDREIFGQQVEDSPQPPRAYDRKFYINHNLLFKKESLTDQFHALLQTTKEGLIQLREITRGNRSPPRVERMEEGQLNFRKKPSRKEIKTDRTIGLQGQPEGRPNKTSITKRAEGSAERTHQSPRSIRLLPPADTPQRPAKNAIKPQKKGGSVVSRGVVGVRNEGGHVPFEDDLLSQVNSGHDSSIISHISIEQIGKSRFDKWDILYQEE